MIHMLHLSFIPRKQRRGEKTQTSCFCRGLYCDGVGFILRHLLSKPKRFSFLHGWLPLCDQGGTCCFGDGWLTGVGALTPPSWGYPSDLYPHTSSSLNALLHSRYATITLGIGGKKYNIMTLQCFRCHVLCKSCAYFCTDLSAVI